MKKIYLIALISLLSVVSIQIFGQEVPPDKRSVWASAQKGFLVISGDISAIKGQKTLNISISQQIQKMGTKYMPDSVFIANRVKEFNEEKAGKGDKWLEEWNKELNNFNPAFVEGSNKVTAKSGLKVALNDPSAEYTCLITTKHLMEFWGKIYVILDMDVVKTNDPGTIVATVRFPLVCGTKTSKLYQEKNESAYYTAGLTFGKYFIKTAL